jgi:hypothetical protein
VQRAELYKVGEYLKRKNHTAGKFDLRWTGPYIVTEASPMGTYRLMRRDGKYLKSMIHHNDLAPYTGNRRLYFGGQGRVGPVDALADADLQAEELGEGERREVRQDNEVQHHPDEAVGDYRDLEEDLEDAEDIEPERLVIPEPDPPNLEPNEPDPPPPPPINDPPLIRVDRN